MQNINVNQCVPGEHADKQCKYCPLVVYVHSWVLRETGSHLGQQRNVTCCIVISDLKWLEIKDEVVENSLILCEKHEGQRAFRFLDFI